MAAKRSKKFVLGLRKLRETAAASEATADAAITAGRQAIKDARAAGDLKAVKAHTKTLAEAKTAKRNLAGAVKLLKAACCDQFLNCDPDFN